MQSDILKAQPQPRITPRAARIALQLAPHLSPGQCVLEIGAGDGLVAQALQDTLSLDMSLVDLVDYNRTNLALDLYDGSTLPFHANSFDYALLIFVLHHTPEPIQVLREALRVSRRGVLVVENDVEGWLRQRVTRVVDSIPHWRIGVPRCYHTLSAREWCQAIQQLPVRAEMVARFSLPGFWKNFVLRVEKPPEDGQN